MVEQATQNIQKKPEERRKRRISLIIKLFKREATRTTANGIYLQSPEVTVQHGTLRGSHKIYVHCTQIRVNDHGL